MISHAAATDIPIAHPIIPPNEAENIFCMYQLSNKMSSYIDTSRYPSSNNLENKKSENYF